MQKPLRSVYFPVYKQLTKRLPQSTIPSVMQSARNANQCYPGKPEFVEALGPCLPAVV